MAPSNLKSISLSLFFFYLSRYSGIMRRLLSQFSLIFGYFVQMKLTVINPDVINALRITGRNKRALICKIKSLRELNSARISFYFQNNLDVSG